MMIDVLRHGPAADTAWEDAILAHHKGFTNGRWDATLPWEIVVPGAGEADPVDADSIKTIKGFSLGMSAETGIVVDSDMIDGLERIPRAIFPEDDALLH